MQVVRCTTDQIGLGHYDNNDCNNFATCGSFNGGDCQSNAQCG